ncbi:Wzz/FepE/Etk N-terminal domain-containing protein [Paenalcaligenes niemegkensis]|uniref:LPS O-antigen chain length determinant protein WzzB n=1 Tax=Paenalcaligenes niemegkensis TaxID=2895469 RepID=UPI001EE7912E|nr:Wzz/FepE/Etk N-terminal domain-containing protein [Paenalcaligenes niemegkensis]MCQ9618285.1 Wzz/FepE/Etk N-terminal domain-containing protein [Paenalcaligenes niemegkensis]
MSEDRAQYHVNNNSDEIDLRDLACTLWKQKVLIVVCTVIVTAVAAAYAFLSSPVYEAEVLTLPPTPADLASYNIVTQIDKDFKELTPEQAYQIFLRHLNSASLKLDFFNNEYLPVIEPEPSPAERERLWKGFNKILTVTLPKANTSDLATVAIQGEAPVTISDWTNKYLDQAIARSREEVINTLDSAVNVRVESTETQVSTLRASAERERSHQIARIQEALQLAQAIRLETPPDSGNLITSYTGETTYLRGTNALESELKLLQTRQNNDPYIDKLPELLRKLDILKTVNLQPERLTVATIDSAAVPPEDPIKPKKALILLLGIVLGGMLGVFLALMRGWLASPKS